MTDLDDPQLEEKLEAHRDSEHDSLFGPGFFLAVLRRLKTVSYRARVVQELPNSAPEGLLLVKAGEPGLYIGAGAGNPLRRYSAIGEP